MTTPTAPDTSEHGADTEVTVYWRPGCPFCSRLLRFVERAGIEVELRDIWEDPDAATTVREITGGNETVPTVTIGAVSMVNPSPRALGTALAEHAPGRLPAEWDGSVGWWERLTGR